MSNAKSQNTTDEPDEGIDAMELDEDFLLEVLIKEQDERSIAEHLQVSKSLHSQQLLDLFQRLGISPLPRRRGDD